MASSSQCSEECNRLVLEAINESGESSVSKLKLAISSYSESEILASISQCNEEGETPLGVAMKGKNVDLIDNLAIFLQNCKCLSDNQILFWNAIEKLFHQISIVKFLELLVNQLNEFYDTDWLAYLSQIFIFSSSFTRQESIDALELFGAMSIINLPISMERGYTVHQTGLGLEIWSYAMAYRYLPADGEPLLPKIADVLVPSVASSVVYGSAVEVNSMEELDLLEEHFKRDFTSDQDAVRLTCKKLMKRQALLVVRRVTSQSNSEHPHKLYLESLLEFGSALEMERNPGSNALIINTYLLILEQMAGFDPKLLPRKLFDFFLCTLHNLSLNFILMLRQPFDSILSQEVSYANFLPPTKFFGTIAKFFTNPAMISSIEVNYNIFGVCRHLAYFGHIDMDHDVNLDMNLDYRFNCAELVFNFVAVLESLSPRLSSQEKQQLEKYLSIYIRTLFPERTTTVLHAAVGQKEDGLKLRIRAFRTVTNFEPMIKLLLKLGADPNAIDEKGRTPLHLLAENEGFLSVGNVSLFRALVDAGTHPDMAADDGETVLSLLKAASKNQNIADPYYESLNRTVFPLSCYCARVIRRHGIRYDEDRIPLTLQEFVSRHSAKKSNDLLEHGENN